MKIQNRLYLSTLRLQNFATFQDEEIEFNRGFNAIIGETGSGKSLILDALQLILGMRADKKSVRKDAEFAVVEAVFLDVDKEVHEYLDSIGHPSHDQNEIVLKRIIYNSGSSKAYLNFQQCSLSILTDFARRFTDLVGQFENQKLLSESYQLKLLDTYASLQERVDTYANIYSELQETTNLILQKEEDIKERQQKKDYLEFQLKEIEELNPEIQDEEELLERKEGLIFSQQNREILAKAVDVLSENDEFNIINSLKRINKDMEKLKGIQLGQAHEKLQESLNLLQDISFDLSRSLDIEASEGELEQILDRLDRYQKLKRKFHVETQGLVELQQKFQQELNELNEADGALEQLKTKKKELEQTCFKLAQELHKLRLKSSESLSVDLTVAVQKLKMNGAQLRYNIIKSEQLTKTGISKIDFIAETNPGEGFFKVKDIASGGELSRILLSLRQILAANDTVSIFLFDEIDTGVGGETALAIGQALENVSQKSQVIAITHLPQIAHYASKLHIINKETINTDKKARTISVARSIIADEKKTFVQNMASIN